MARPVFRFNGVDQYATHPDWTPNGLPFEVRVKAVPLTVGSTSNWGNIWSSSGQAFRGNGRFGGYNVRKVADIAPPITAIVGEAVALALESNAAEDKVTANGIEASSSANLGLPPQAVGFIGAANATAFWHGPIYDIEYIDNSPIQDTDILEGNGTRYVEIPEFRVEADEDFRISYDWIRQDAALSTAIVSESDAASTNSLTAANTGGDDRLSITGSARTEGIVGVNADVAIGQHTHTEVTVLRQGANDRFMVDVDGASKADYTNISIGTFTAEQIGKLRDRATEILPTGSALQNVTLENLTTGDYVRYAIDEGSGTVIKAYDRDGNEIPETIRYDDPSPITSTGEWEDPVNGTHVVDAGYLRLTNVGTVTARVARAVSVEVGKPHKLFVDTGTGTGSCVVRVGDAPDGAQYVDATQGANVTGGEYEFVPAQSVIYITHKAASSTDGRTSSWTNIRVQRVANGTVTPDASWANVPDNSRHYPANEQTGDKFKCYQKGVHVPALDATIQNFDNASWDILPPGGYGSGPGVTTSDARFDYLRSQLYTGSTNEMLLKWLQDNGAATSTTLPDAWKEMLVSKGFTQESRIDAWFALLRGQGHTGTISDMELQFWEGGAVLPP